MTRLLIIVFLTSLLSNFSFAQEEDYVLLLPPITKAVEGVEFTCSKVIDLRADRDNIGFVQKGLQNRKLPAVFIEDFDVFLEKTFRKLCLRGEQVPSFVFIIHEFSISEKTSNSSEFGYCRVQLEVAREEGEELFSCLLYTSPSPRDS